MASIASDPLGQLGLAGPGKRLAGGDGPALARAGEERERGPRRARPRAPDERLFAARDPESLEALYIPGSAANPDRLRRDDQVVDFVCVFSAAGKPVAPVCMIAGSATAARPPRVEDARLVR
jgi:putative intracellular protease/amidase